MGREMWVVRVFDFEYAGIFLKMLKVTGSRKVGEWAFEIGRNEGNSAGRTGRFRGRMNMSMGTASIER